MTATGSDHNQDVDRSRFSEISIAIALNTGMTLKGSFSLAEARPLIDQFWQEQRTGATPAEQRALAARLNTLADTLHTTGLALGALDGTP